jgi:hypothetical protein
MRTEKLSHFCLSLVLLVFIVSGLGGIDFGIHWDEGILLGGIEHSVLNATPLPDTYWYSSLPHDMGLLSLFPDGLGYILSHHTLNGLKAHLVELVRAPAFLLRMRANTVLITSLACLWAYLGVFYWRRSGWEALLAAAGIGLSWEINYHSRWYTTDPLLMQCGALCLASALAAQRGRAKLFLSISAMAAGLGFATKYPGGLLLLVPLSSLTRYKKPPVHVLTLAAFFVAAAIAAMPGLVFDFPTVLQDAMSMVIHYRGGHVGYDVPAGWPHAVLMITYLSKALFSKYAVISLVFFVLSVLGGFAVLKEKDPAWPALLIFPAAYFLYFSVQKVMIVRNILVLLPFLAVLAARGAFFVESRLTQKMSLALFRFLLVACCVMNAAWEIHAMQTIRHRNDADQAAELARYVHAHPREKFLVPTGLSGQVTGANVTSNAEEKTDYAVFNTYAAKGRFDGRWPANRYGFATTWFGSYEVNLNYYPTWWGNHRLVVMPTERALRVLLPADDRRR